MTNAQILAAMVSVRPKMLDAIYEYRVPVFKDVKTGIWIGGFIYDPEGKRQLRHAVVIGRYKNIQPIGRFYQIRKQNGAPDGRPLIYDFSSMNSLKLEEVSGLNGIFDAALLVHMNGRRAERTSFAAFLDSGSQQMSALLYETA